MLWMDLDEDHPRGCGEHVLNGPLISIVVGSSPRMRGTPWPDRHDVLEWRIIPADAGNTDDEDDYEEEMLDHPRGCGEHHP